MASLTFTLDTDSRSRIEIKKQIATYCIERDYQYYIDEIQSGLNSQFKVSIDLPDNKLAEELKVFQVWGENMRHTE